MIKTNKQRYGFEPQCTNHGWILSFNVGPHSIHFGLICLELLNITRPEFIQKLIEFGAYPPQYAWACPHFLFKENIELLIEEFIEPRLLALKMADWDGRNTSLWKEYWRLKK